MLVQSLWGLRSDEALQQLKLELWFLILLTFFWFVFDIQRLILHTRPFWKQNLFRFDWKRSSTASWSTLCYFIRPHSYCFDAWFSFLPKSKTGKRCMKSARKRIRLINNNLPQIFLAGITSRVSMPTGARARTTIITTTTHNRGTYNNNNNHTQRWHVQQ